MDPNDVPIPGLRYKNPRVDPRPFQGRDKIVPSIDPDSHSGLDNETIRFQSGIPEQQRPSHEKNRGDGEPDNQREYPYRHKDLACHESHYRFPEQERENGGDECEETGDNLVFERDVRDHVFWGKYKQSRGGSQASRPARARRRERTIKRDNDA